MSDRETKIKQTETDNVNPLTRDALVPMKKRERNKKLRKEGWYGYEESLSRRRGVIHCKSRSILHVAETVQIVRLLFEFYLSNLRSLDRKVQHRIDFSDKKKCFLSPGEIL